MGVNNVRYNTALKLKPSRMPNIRMAANYCAYRIGRFAYRNEVTKGIYNAAADLAGLAGRKVFNDYRGGIVRDIIQGSAVPHKTGWQYGEFTVTDPTYTIMKYNFRGFVSRYLTGMQGGKPIENGTPYVRGGAELRDSLFYGPSRGQHESGGLQPGKTLLGGQDRERYNTAMQLLETTEKGLLARLFQLWYRGKPVENGTPFNPQIMYTPEFAKWMLYCREKGWLNGTNEDKQASYAFSLLCGKPIEGGTSIVRKEDAEDDAVPTKAANLAFAIQRGASYDVSDLSYTIENGTPFKPDPNPGK